MKGRRVVFTTRGKAELEEFDIRAPKGGQVLLEIEYSAVSAGTEKAFLTGEPNTSKSFPRYPGYSAVGRIISLGPEVTGLSLGERVLVRSRHASHMIASQEDLIIPIEDESCPSKEASFLIIAAHSMQGIRKARIEPGEHICVIGLGLLGLFAVQFARLNGGFPVTAFDYNESRRKVASIVGADYVFAPGDSDFVDKLEETGLGRANVVIEVTGFPEAMQQALACAAGCGRVISLGCTRRPVRELDIYRYIHRPGVVIIGAHSSARPTTDSYPGHWTMQDELRTLISLLAAGRIKVAPMVGRTAVPEEAPDVYEKLARDENVALGVVFDWR